MIRSKLMHQGFGGPLALVAFCAFAGSAAADDNSAFIEQVGTLNISKSLIQN